MVLKTAGGSVSTGEGVDVCGCNSVRSVGDDRWPGLVRTILARYLLFRVSGEYNTPTIWQKISLTIVFCIMRQEIWYFTPHYTKTDPAHTWEKMFVSLHLYSVWRELLWHWGPEERGPTLTKLAHSQLSTSWLSFLHFTRLEDWRSKLEGLQCLSWTGG